MMMNFFCGMVDRRKAFMPYFQLGPLSEILPMANIRHAASSISLFTSTVNNDSLEMQYIVMASPLNSKLHSKIFM